MDLLWRHLAFNYREGGIRQVLAKVVTRAIAWFSSETSYLVYRVPLAEYSRETHLGLVVRPLAFDQLLELRYFRAIDFPELVQRALAEGRVCHGFFLDGALANIAWTARDRLELEPGWFIDLPGSIAISNCWTFDAFRGRGIYPEAVTMLLQAARREGVANALIAVDLANLPSIKGIERAGFVPLFCVTRRIQFGREREWREPFAPFLP